MKSPILDSMAISAMLLVVVLRQDFFSLFLQLLRSQTDDLILCLQVTRLNKKYILTQVSYI